MNVIATAGHVDHGKSALVRALTTMDPDRWEEEKRRGLTIDLGFAWTRLPSGADLAVVDVPGHERFLSNTLAGLGPVQHVMLVVAADEGWQAQSSDHRDVIAALGLTGLVVLTRSDRASAQRCAEVEAQVRQELAGTSLAASPIVRTSAVTGEGLGALKSALDELLSSSEPARATGRVRLWIDRAFTIKGAGTVVTGTLSAGEIQVGDTLDLLGVGPVEVRGLHSENQALDRAVPVSRVAVNLRGVATSAVSRGDQLLSPDAWLPVRVVDVEAVTGSALTQLPEYVAGHAGTAQWEVRVRPLSDNFARLTLPAAAALEVGDRLVLRGPGSRNVLAGVEIRDIDPPPLNRRGGARRRAEALSAGPVDAAAYLKRVGAQSVERLRLLQLAASKPAGVIEFSGWWIYAPQVTRWKELLLAAVEKHAVSKPLAPGLPQAEAIQVLGLPAPELLGLAVAAARLELRAGVISKPGAKLDLGPADAAISKLEKRWSTDPFAAPEAKELQEWGLGPKQLAAAQRGGRVLKIGDNIVLSPKAVEKARLLLLELPQPFTTSQARQAWGTTRRVAIPLLEHLDTLGVTVRLDGTNRRLA